MKTGNYRETKTNYTEELSVLILNELGINVKRNNLQNKTAVDLILENKIRMDVQYSQDFKKWGDLRIDFISAYLSKDNKNVSNLDSLNLKKEIKSLFEKFQKDYDKKVVKVGKYFQDNYLDAVIILFYNEKLDINKPKEENLPNKILIINKDNLLNYIVNNIDKLNIKLNDKNGLGDKHGSAFIPVNVKSLVKDTKCFYGSLEELKSQSKEIKKYLNL